MILTPSAIQKYLNDYPQFNVFDDISNSFVRTSIESFHSAVSLVHQSLKIDEVVWSTDNLGLSLNFANYWIEEGLQYLRVNHESTGRGIKIIRVFIVLDEEYKNFRKELNQILTLHALTGVKSHVAIYERLPNECRYDFAIWGDKYVDEVVYDMKSNHIVDNRIHWSVSKHVQFLNKSRIISNMVEKSIIEMPDRASNFDSILNYAASIRQEIDSLSKNRFQKISNTADSKEAPKPIRILLLAANPKDTNSLKLDTEYREIDAALRNSNFRDRFILEKHSAIRVSDLQSLLLRYQPDIVHFSGHGTSSGEIILENALGLAQPVSSAALTKLFSILKDNICCVLLNACYSEIQAKAIAAVLPCVIGMSKAVGDDAAIKFSTAFYQAIGYGRSLKSSFELGCLQIELDGLNEENTPKFHCNDEDSSLLSLV